MAPLVKVPTMEGRVQLMATQLIGDLKRKESTFVATIASSKEDNGAKGSMPLCTRKENNIVMPKKPPRCMPPRNEVNHKTELKEIKNKMKELHEGVC